MAHTHACTHMHTHTHINILYVADVGRLCSVPTVADGKSDIVNQRGRCECDACMHTCTHACTHAHTHTHINVHINILYVADVGLGSPPTVTDGDSMTTIEGVMNGTHTHRNVHINLLYVADVELGSPPTVADGDSVTTIEGDVNGTHTHTHMYTLTYCMQLTLD